MKHTPGPWTVERESDRGGWKGIAVKAEHAVVANLVMQLTENELANAKVIAAAPDLLAAVRAILFQVCQGAVLERDACVSQARNAMRKATTEAGGGL